MASWKKVIVSGSKAVLAEVTASAGFSGDGSNLTGIAADSLGNALTVDNATIQLDSGTTFNGSAGRTISIKDGGVDADALATGVAGTGLAGGGGTALSVDLNELTDATLANGDSIAFIDATDSNATKKETVADFVNLIAGGGSSMLTAANSALTVDLDQASAATVDVAADSIAIIDANDSNGTKKEAIADVVSGISGNGLQASSGVIRVGAGTGIDVSSTEVSVDVSDFMTNGLDNRIVTATGTDAMNGEANLTFDGSKLTVTGQVTASSHISSSGNVYANQFHGDGSNLTNVTGEVNIDGLGDSGVSNSSVDDADEFIFSDGGTEKKISYAELYGNIFGEVDGDASIAVGGGLTIANDAVEGTMLNTNSADGTTMELSSDSLSVLKVPNALTAGTGLSSAGTFDGAAARTINVDLSSLSSHTIGAGTSEITIGDNLTVTGDLTVNGDRNIVSTTNLLVEDKFITIASGSTSAGDGGIVVQTAANGSGAPLAFDSGTRRWALGGAGTLSGIGTTFDSAKPQFDYIVGVSGSATDPAVDGTPQLGTTNHYYGSMHVNTATGDIFIYS